MEFKITLRAILFFILFSLFSFAFYQGYQMWNYLYATIGKSATGQPVSRSQLIDQILGERFASGAAENGTKRPE